MRMATSNGVSLVRGGRCNLWQGIAKAGRAPRKQALSVCFANSDNGNVAVRFQLPYHCKYGQKLCLIGANECLGAWDVANAVPMEWTEGDLWTVELQLPKNGAELEYKYVVRHERDKTAVRWKEGGNLLLQLPPAGQLRVHDTWDESARDVEVVDTHRNEQQLYSAERQHKHHHQQQQQHSQNHPWQEQQQAPHPQLQPQSRVAAPQPVFVQQQAREQPQTTTAFSPPAATATIPPTPSPRADSPEVLRTADASPAVRRQRRRKVDEDDLVAETIAKAANKAMQQLDGAVSRSLELLSVSSDPAAPDLLAADRQVAAAARRAATMNRALDAAKEAKLLPPTGTKTPRRRRKDSS